jgi:TonB family protein
MKIKNILLGINLYCTVAFAQNYHGTIIPNGKQGDKVQVPIVLRQIDLDKNTSLSFVAADSIKPATVGIVFASDDSVGDCFPTILNPLGSDIPLSLGTNSQFINAVNKYRDLTVISSSTELSENVINQHKVIGIAEVSWDMFELFCRLDSIRISTKHRVIVLNCNERKILSEFYLYLVEREERPPDFVPYDMEPIVIKRVEPKYPESALRDSLEGTVYIKVWVDRKGRVREAVVLKLRNKLSNDIFTASAIEAAKQWVFTPALIKGESVSVWVSIPFRFRLPKKIN